MAKQKFYAVRKGIAPGIYKSYDDVQANVAGFPDAEHASFSTEEEAKYYLEHEGVSKADATRLVKPDILKPVVESVDLKPMPMLGTYAFVDGSFNPETKRFGYGGFLMVNGRSCPLMGSDTDPDMAKMRNVAGEIIGSMAAVKKAEALGVKNLKIFYDYRGIEEWVTGGWQTTKEGTRNYAKFMNSPDRTVNISFEHVDAHTGIEGNEMADVMAKHAVGIELTKSQKALFDKAVNMGRRDGVANVSLDDVPFDLQYGE